MAKTKTADVVVTETITTPEPTFLTVSTEETQEFISTNDSADFALNLLLDITANSPMKSQISSKVDEIRHLLRF